MLALATVLLAPAQAGAGLKLPGGFAEVTVASGLHDPTALAFVVAARATDACGRALLAALPSPLRVR